MTPTPPAPAISLQQCIDWLDLIGSTYFEAVDTTNPKFHEYRQAILSHLRQSCAPKVESWVTASERDALEWGALELDASASHAAEPYKDEMAVRAGILRGLSARLTKAEPTAGVEELKDAEILAERLLRKGMQTIISARDTEIAELKAAMVKARNELAGVGPNSSKEFHGMGICSALGIIDAALTAGTGKETQR